MLALDLGVFNRKAHVVSLKEALAWCAVWFGLAMAFNLLIALKMPATAAGNPALEFFTGYIVELCLSVDNVFVFIVIFQYFRVDPKHQHRVLFWGIIGALLMRGAMIFAGAALIKQFHWIIWIFGAFLIFTGIKMLWMADKEENVGDNPVLSGPFQFLSGIGWRGIFIRSLGFGRVLIGKPPRRRRCGAGRSIGWRGETAPG